ncbi:MAG: MotA/TolQ/ExbB proton channel family protein [Polyangiaceae bacterium]
MFIAALATLWWSLRIWKRRNELPRWAQLAAGLAAASAVLGGFGTVAGLLKAFGAMGSTSEDPSQKARMLGEGIATAMNCTALGIFVWLPSAIALALLTRRQSLSAKSDEP